MEHRTIGIQRRTNQTDLETARNTDEVLLLLPLGLAGRAKLFELIPRTLSVL